MVKLTATYHAPPGDSKVVEAFGHTFFDGKAEQVEVPDHVAAKMRGNRHFECSDDSGAKPLAKLAPIEKPAPIEKARQHDAPET